MNFATAIEAGLTQGELARAIGVSRVTINLWLNGKMKPHRYNAANIAASLEILGKAIAQGLIPRPLSRRKPRHEGIAKAMQQVTAQLTT